MIAQMKEQEFNELELYFLSLIHNNIHLEDFPLLEYSSDEIFNVLMKLKNNGYINLSFDYSSNNGNNSIDMRLTHKGKELLFETI
jgi:ribosomal protein S8